jgi:hypothetical protein
MLAVVYALHKYGTYIFGKHVAVFSDNQALKFPEAKLLDETDDANAII